MKRTLALTAAIAAFLVALPVLAWADPANTGMPPEGAVEKIAVPQFDPSTYAGQLFWLAVTFSVLYVLMAKVALPRIGFVIDQREGRLQQDMATAKNAALEASQLQADYEAALQQARTSAREQLATANANAVVAQTTALARQAADLTSRLQTAESNITNARTAAISSITPAAVATAATALHKLTGVDVAGERLATAVDAVLKRAS